MLIDFDHDDDDCYDGDFDDNFHSIMVILTMMVTVMIKMTTMTVMPDGLTKIMTVMQVMMTTIATMTTVMTMTVMQDGLTTAEYGDPCPAKP